MKDFTFTIHVGDWLTIGTRQFGRIQTFKAGGNKPGYNQTKPDAVTIVTDESGYTPDAKTQILGVYHGPIYTYDAKDVPAFKEFLMRLSAK